MTTLTQEERAAYVEIRDEYHRLDPWEPDVSAVALNVRIGRLLEILDRLMAQGPDALGILRETIETFEHKARDLRAKEQIAADLPQEKSRLADKASTYEYEARALSLRLQGCEPTQGREGTASGTPTKGSGGLDREALGRIAWGAKHRMPPGAWDLVDEVGREGWMRAAEAVAAAIRAPQGETSPQSKEGT